MADPFEASYLKIERAKKHLAEIKTVAHEYLAAGPATVVTRKHERGFEFQMSVKGPPLELSAIAGDIFHNLRSALDLMAAELCGSPGAPDPDARFPFCAEESEL